jgi:hypothetical protein
MMGCLPYGLEFSRLPARDWLHYHHDFASKGRLKIVGGASRRNKLLGGLVAILSA